MRYQIRLHPLCEPTGELAGSRKGAKNCIGVPGIISPSVISGLLISIDQATPTVCAASPDSHFALSCLGSPACDARIDQVV